MNNDRKSIRWFHWLVLVVAWRHAALSLITTRRICRLLIRSILTASYSYTAIVLSYFYFSSAQYSLLIINRGSYSFYPFNIQQLYLGLCPTLPYPYSLNTYRSANGFHKIIATSECSSARSRSRSITVRNWHLFSNDIVISFEECKFYNFL